MLLCSRFQLVLLKYSGSKNDICRLLSTPTKCECRQVIESKHYGSKVSNRSAKTSVRWNALLKDYELKTEEQEFLRGVVRGLMDITDVPITIPHGDSDASPGS